MHYFGLLLCQFNKSLYFYSGVLAIIDMTTSISIPKDEYIRAKDFAQSRNLSIDELLVTLIRMLPDKQEDEMWYKDDVLLQPYTLEELQERIDEGEAQFERGEFVTHEIMMANLKNEFSWLK